MNYTLLAGFISFSFVSGFTPGPNNLIALATGANFGYRRTLPHACGVVLGFNVIFLLMGAGLGSLFKAFPLAHQILKWGSLTYLMVLAWKIATATGIGSVVKNGETAKPITFLGSVGFQWINPKVWVAGITLVTAFTDPEAYWLSLVMGLLINIPIAFAAISMWTLFGTLLTRFLEHPIWLRIFNISMAALLIISVIPSVLNAT
ncbi:MAG TPA: LysE family translocator [Treponemataceae bacterium]|nr:LysE family translocator [Treponemataceae bacterium]